ncbi:MAG: ATP synthase subunit I [Pseudomonadales bacterium]|nr:ATP synthase subunit I [Pseudomonadales bacterium]
MNVAFKIIAVQGVLGGLSTLLFFVADNASGHAAGLAAVAVILPGAYFAWVQSRTLNPTRILLHSALKSVLTIVLMALFLVTQAIEPIGFFVTFVVMQLGYLSGAKLR